MRPSDEAFDGKFSRRKKVHSRNCSGEWVLATFDPIGRRSSLNFEDERSSVKKVTEMKFAVGTLRSGHRRASNRPTDHSASRAVCRVWQQIPVADK